MNIRILQVFEMKWVVGNEDQEDTPDIVVAKEQKRFSRSLRSFLPELERVIFEASKAGRACVSMRRALLTSDNLSARDVEVHRGFIGANKPTVPEDDFTVYYGEDQ